MASKHALLADLLLQHNSTFIILDMKGDRLHPAVIATLVLVPVIAIVAFVAFIVWGFNLQQAFRERTRSPDLEASLSSGSANSIASFSTTESTFIGQYNIPRPETYLAVPARVQHVGRSNRVVRFASDVAIATKHRQRTSTGSR